MIGFFEKKSVSAMAAILTLVLLVGFFVPSNRTFAADNNDQIYVCEQATSDKIYTYIESEKVYLNEFVYCADMNKRGPGSTTGETKYTKTVLSDREYTATQKSMLVYTLLNSDKVKDYISTLQSPMAQQFLDSYSDNGYVIQILLWCTVSEDEYIQKTGNHGYAAIAKACGDTTENYDTDGSFWKEVLKPALDYIKQESVAYPVGTATGEYNANFYICQKTNIQNLFGRPYMNIDDSISLTIKKNLVFPDNFNHVVSDEIYFNIVSGDGDIVGSYKIEGTDSKFTKSGNTYTATISIPLTRSDETFIVIEEGGNVIGYTSNTRNSLNGGAQVDKKRSDRFGLSSGNVQNLEFWNEYQKVDSDFAIVKKFSGAEMSEEEKNKTSFDLYALGPTDQTLPPPYKTLTLKDDFTYDVQTDCYICVVNDIDLTKTYYLAERSSFDETKLRFYPRFQVTGYDYHSQEDYKSSMDNMLYDNIENCFFINLGNPLKDETVYIDNYYEIIGGTLDIWKEFEGVDADDLKDVTYTVTDSNGKEIGTYTIGNDFYKGRSAYILYLRDLDTRQTYTITETNYKIDGKQEKVTYKVDDNDSVEGTVVSGLTIEPRQHTKVVFTNSYEAITTTVPEPAETTETTETSATTATTETSETTEPSESSKSATVIAVEGSEETTTSETQPTAPSSDEAKVTADGAMIGLTTPTDTATTTATPTPTSVPSKSSKNETSRYTSTGEKISVFVLIGGTCIAASVIFLEIRRRYNAKNS